MAELKKSDPQFTLWASVGRFGWKRVYDGAPGIQAETQLHQGKPYPEKVVALIKGGFFESAGQHYDKYVEVKAAFDRHVDKVRSQWVW